MRWKPNPGPRASQQKQWAQRCEERVQSLGLPLSDRLSIEELCRHIGELRQRSVRLILLTLPSAGPHGLWVSTESHDYIFVEQLLVPVHQQQVILHEIGHVVCDHHASPILTEEASQLLLPSLDVNVVRQVMGREHSNSEAEIEAEFVGSLIGQRISTWTVQRTWAVPPEALEIAQRLTALETPKPGKRRE
jgi:hypothetical protein